MNSVALLEGGGDQDAAEWASSCDRFFGERMKERMRAPSDGRRSKLAPTRAHAPEGWTGLMITDCGYATLGFDRYGVHHEIEEEAKQRGEPPYSQVALWMTGRNEEGRSVCLWVHYTLPYFYVGVSINRDEWALSKEYLQWIARKLKRHLRKRSDRERGQSSRKPEVLEVRLVRRRWFYGYRHDPNRDGQNPVWQPDGEAGEIAEGMGTPHRPWSTDTTGHTDWYLKVCAGAPFYVSTLRKWAAEWVERRTQKKDPKGNTWRIPVVRTTSTIQAPVNLTVFEANVEFSLRFMIDRGLVGCGWCALDLSAGTDRGLLASYGPKDGKAEGKRSRCELEYVVDGHVFEMAESARDRALVDGLSPWEPMRRVLDGHCLRFVARESELQQYVDGRGKGANAEHVARAETLVQRAEADLKALEVFADTDPKPAPPFDPDLAKRCAAELHKLGVPGASLLASEPQSLQLCEEVRQKVEEDAKKDHERRDRERVEKAERNRQYMETVIQAARKQLAQAVAEAADPMEAWFQDLRKATAPLTVMTFDIECCNQTGAFPEPDKDDGQVINVAARVYRIDRVEAYERRREVTRRLGTAQGGHPPKLEALGFDAGLEDDIKAAQMRRAVGNQRKAASDLVYFDRYVKAIRDRGGYPFLSRFVLALLAGQDEKLRQLSDEEVAERKKKLVARAKLTTEELGLLQNEPERLQGSEWPPPLDAVVLGLGSREGMRDGGMDGYPVSTFSFGSESEMLIALSRLILVWDPDIIEGYNSVAFDMAYLLRRAEHLEIWQQCWELGRLLNRRSPPKQQKFGNKAKGKRSEYRAQIHGRAQFDVYKVCDADIAYSPRSYRLDDVAKDLLEEGKTGLKYAQIPIKHNGTDADRRELDEYCDADAVLPFKIERHQSYLMRYIELARVTGVPLSFLLTKGQQVLVFAQLLRKARQEGYAVPWLPVVEPERSLTEARKTKAYQGAIVIDPKAGFYTVHRTGPVVVNDYKSLYPMSMISQNLGYTTHVTDSLAAQACRETHARRKQEHDERHLAEDPWYDGDLKVREYEAEGGWKVAPVQSKAGIPDPVFVRPEVRKSLLAMILEALLAARARVKREMKKYPKGSATYKKLDAEQMAIKVCCNSVYGFTGAPVGRQPDLAISGATTAYGRCGLYFAERLAEKLLPGDNEVIYGDTDSVMILIKDACTGETPKPGEPLSDRAIQAIRTAFERGKLLDKEVNSRLLAPMELETEKVYSPFLLLGKKKYVTLMWMTPEAPFDTDAKGIEMVRRDNPQIVGMACKTFAKLLMGKGPKVEGKKDQRVALWPDVDTGEALLREVHRRMLCDELSYESYIISGKFGKPAGEYATIPAHVALAMRMQERDPGSAPQVGNRVPYVVVRPEFTETARLRHEPARLVRDRSEDPDWAQEHGMGIDNEYYARKKFEPPFLRMLAPVRAAEELASGTPKDPRMYTRQKRRYRNDPDKFEAWVKNKRQELAEDVVRAEIFRENYRQRKIRKTMHGDCALERAFGWMAEQQGDHLPTRPADEDTSSSPAWSSARAEERHTDKEEEDEEDQVLGPEEQPAVDDDARQRIKAELKSMLAAAREEMAKRGELAGGGEPPRKKQRRITGFFVPGPNAVIT